MGFSADLEANDDGGLQIMYGIDGRRDLTETTRDDLSGYVGATPGRVGNDACDQRQNDVLGPAPAPDTQPPAPPPPLPLGTGAFAHRQNDVFGPALASTLLPTRRSQRLPRRLWPIVQAQ